MKTNDWGFSFSESFLKKLTDLNKIQPSLFGSAISEVWRNSIPKTNFADLTACLNAYMDIPKFSIDTTIPASALLDFSEKIKTWQSTVAPITIDSSLPLVDQTKLSSTWNISIATTMAKSDWSWISDVFAETRIGSSAESPVVLEEENEKSLSSDIRDEIAADVSEILSSPEDISVVSRSKYLRWKERNPGAAAFFIEVLLPLLSILLSFFQILQAHPVKETRVYEQPSSTANVVCNISIDQDVFLVGDAPYYYEIEVIDPDTGETIRGFAYKGNFVEEPLSEQEQDEDDLNATE